MASTGWRGHVRSHVDSLSKSQTRLFIIQTLQTFGCKLTLVIVSVLVIEMVVTKVVDDPFSSVVVKVVATVSTVVEAQSSQDMEEDVVASATGVEDVVSAATGVDEVVFQSSQVIVDKVDSAGVVVEASATGVKLVLL